MIKNIQQLSAKMGAQLNPLLLSLKQANKNMDENKFLEAIFGPQKQKSKREADRDRKVEALLEAYKKSDEATMRKEHQRDETKRQN